MNAIVVIVFRFIRNTNLRESWNLTFTFDHNNEIDSISYNSFERRIICQIEHDGRISLVGWLLQKSLKLRSISFGHTQCGIMSTITVITNTFNCSLFWEI